MRPSRFLYYIPLYLNTYCIMWKGIPIKPCNNLKVYLPISIILEQIKVKGIPIKPCNNLKVYLPISIILEQIKSVFAHFNYT
jgi:hypothetical protein